MIDKGSEDEKMEQQESAVGGDTQIGPDGMVSRAGMPLLQKIARKQRHRFFAEDQVYHFSTVALVAAAKRKWGAKSRRVQALYGLLAEMIDESEKKQ